MESRMEPDGARGEGGKKKMTNLETTNVATVHQRWQTITGVASR